MSRNTSSYVSRHHPSLVHQSTFAEWCDEQVPPRLAHSNALLYKSTDSKQSTFFAYDLSSLEVLATEAYTSLSKNPSQHVVDLLSRINKFEGRDFQVNFTHQHPGVQLPAKYLLVVAVRMEALVDEESYKKWYREEHMERVSERLPGFRGRTCKCLSQKVLAGQGRWRSRHDRSSTVSYISIHEFDRIPDADAPHSFDTLRRPERSVAPLLEYMRLAN